jgi:hypothetical protein
MNVPIFHITLIDIELSIIFYKINHYSENPINFFKFVLLD